MELVIYKNDEVSRRIRLHSSFFHLETKNGKIVNSPIEKAHQLMHDFRGNGFILHKKETIVKKWGNHGKT